MKLPSHKVMYESTVRRAGERKNVQRVCETPDTLALGRESVQKNVEFSLKFILHVTSPGEF